MKTWNRHRIILASQSPRRKELLESMGLRFEVIPSKVDESYPIEMTPFLIPEMLAVRKAEEVADRDTAHRECIVIGADSMVFLGNKIFEKPSSPANAFQMLAHLSGKTHTVISGVCLLFQGKKVAFSARSEVTFRPMDKAEIDFYIETYKPFDKAGAYGIQDWLGHCKISSIQGTYTNVMGLPTDLVYEGIKSFQ